MFISVYAVDGFLNYFVQPKIKKKINAPDQCSLNCLINNIFCCNGSV